MSVKYNNNNYYYMLKILHTDSANYPADEITQ